MEQIIHDILGKTDLGAVVIGIIALLFSAITLYIQRKHNKLSVKPIAIITVVDYEGIIGVYLENRGTGPLIIKKLLLTNEHGREESALIEFFGDEFKDIKWSTFTGTREGWAILPGKYERLIELKGDSTDKNFITTRDRVRGILAPVRVELHYQDIYEKDMPIKTRNLYSFAGK